MMPPRTSPRRSSTRSCQDAGPLPRRAVPAAKSPAPTSRWATSRSCRSRRRRRSSRRSRRTSSCLSACPARRRAAASATRSRTATSARSSSSAARVARSTTSRSKCPRTRRRVRRLTADEIAVLRPTSTCAPSSGPICSAMTQEETDAWVDPHRGWERGRPPAFLLGGSSDVAAHFGRPTSRLTDGALLLARRSRIPIHLTAAERRKA